MPADCVNMYFIVQPGFFCTVKIFSSTALTYRMEFSTSLWRFCFKIDIFFSFLGFSCKSLGGSVHRWLLFFLKHEYCVFGAAKTRA